MTTDVDDDDPGSNKYDLIYGCPCHHVVQCTIVHSVSICDERTRHNYALMNSKWNIRKSCAHEVWSKFTSVWHSSLLNSPYIFLLLFSSSPSRMRFSVFSVRRNAKASTNCMCVCVCEFACPRRIFHMPCLPLYWCIYIYIVRGSAKNSQRKTETRKSCRKFVYFEYLLFCYSYNKIAVSFL